MYENYGVLKKDSILPRERDRDSDLELQCLIEINYNSKSVRDKARGKVYTEREEDHFVLRRIKYHAGTHARRIGNSARNIKRTNLF